MGELPNDVGQLLAAWDALRASIEHVETSLPQQLSHTVKNLEHDRISFHSAITKFAKGQP